MNRLSAIIVIAALGFSHYAQSQANVIAGLGATSCARWIESRALKDEGVDNFLAAWVQGFLSGVNSRSTYRHTIPGEPRLLASIDKYCQENPEDPVYAASMSLYGEMSKQQ